MLGMRWLAVFSICASLVLGVVACGGSGSSLQNLFQQPSPNPSPALPTPPPVPTPPMLLPNGLIIGTVTLFRNGTQIALPKATA
jgi:hypothetical protein